MGRQVAAFRRGARSLRLTPVVGFVLAANALTFLVEFFAQRPLLGWLVFDGRDITTRPWTMLTHPLVNGSDIIGLLLAGYVFWWVGTSLEREWGSREFGAFFTIVTVLTAVSFAAGARVVGTSVQLAGLLYPLSAVFIAWCMTHPDATVLFMFVIPIRARWLGYLDLAITYFGTGPVMGLFALATPLAAWWYARRLRHRWRLGGRSSLPNPLRALRNWKRRRDFERAARHWGLLDEDALDEASTRGRAKRWDADRGTTPRE